MPEPTPPLPPSDTSLPIPLGRPKTLSVKPATVMLEPAQIEWGKRQAGGLSAAIRRLLQRAMGEEHPPAHGAQTEATHPDAD